MTQKVKNIIIGIGLLIAAIIVLFKDEIMSPELPIPLWVIIISVVFLIGAYDNLNKKDYPGVFLSVGILALIVNNYYQWITIGIGQTIVALLLGFVGISYIFDQNDDQPFLKIKYKNEKGTDEKDN